MAFFEQIEKVPLKQRALALVVLIIVIIGGFFYFIHQPKAREIKASRDRLTKLSGEVDNLLSIEKRNEEFKTRIADLQGQLASARQQLPGEREIPRLLEEIAGFGKETGIEFISFRPGAESKKDFYNEVPMTLAIKGQFHDIGLFLDKISHYPRIISISNLTMGSPQKKDQYLILTSTCLATTYRYVEK